MVMPCTTSGALTATILLVFVLPPEAVVFGAFELYEAADFFILPDVNYICVPTRQDVRNKILYALSTLSVVGQKPSLVQFWAPKKAGKTFVLTTTQQPFGLYRGQGDNTLTEALTAQALTVYRTGCLQHKLFVHREEDASFGLAGVAFKKGTPHQTANVHHEYYPKDERPPFVNEEIFSLIWGSFAVPVFLDDECVGVLEFVMTEPTHSYDAEINAVCEALKLAGLQSSTKTETPKQTCNTKKINSSKKTEASGIIRRKTASRAYARYNVFAPFFGMSKKHSMEKIASQFNLYRENKTISVTETTFTTALRKAGITAWPHIRNKSAEASENTSYTGTSDTISTSWGEEGISELSRNQTLSPIAYAAETQTNQTVNETSAVADDCFNRNRDGWSSQLPTDPTPATNTFPPEMYNNQLAFMNSVLDSESDGTVVFDDDTVNDYCNYLLEHGDDS